MKTTALTINIVLHIALAAIIIWIVGWFYLGNELTYQNLQDHQPSSFLIRLVGAVLFGMCLQFVILIIDVVYNTSRKSKVDKLSIKKIILASTICNILSTLAGTVIFFAY
jgi:hypothetical protein